MIAALFLDRDGVINVEKNYVHKIKDFEFVSGIFEFCQTALANEYHIFVVTNQAGIGRGYYTTKDFERLNCWMVSEFKKRGITITDVYSCPFHPDAGVGKFKRDSFDRKPNPGMILKASSSYNIDLQSSILVGDKESDIQAAKNAGVGKPVLLTKSAASRDDTVIYVSDLFSASKKLF